MQQKWICDLDENMKMFFERFYCIILNIFIVTSAMLNDCEDITRPIIHYSRKFSDYNTSAGVLYLRQKNFILSTFLQKNKNAYQHCVALHL